MKEIMKTLTLAAAPIVLIMSFFWISGFEFARGAEMGVAFILSVAASFICVVFCSGKFDGWFK
jgi:hypothetical protein